MIITNPAIGIDLGTTYICVCVWKNERAQIIENDQGNRTIPSYVAFTNGADKNGERLIGDAAKNQVAMNPSNTVFNPKRMIGRRFEDRELQKDIMYWSYKMIEKDEKPYIQIEYKGENISGDYLGTAVKDSVITFLAYFHDSQRQPTKNAGTIAGLNVLCIIDKPNAVAITYGLNERDKKLNVLMYNLGGGTFDASLLKIEDGVFEVKTTVGDTHLGGEDFDNRLVIYLMEEFKRKHKKDMSKHPRAVYRLRTAYERLKPTLSSRSQVTIEIDSLFECADFYSTLTQAAILSSNPSDAFDEILLLDIAPLSLGIQTNNCAMSTLVKCNTVLPVRKSEKSITGRDNQTAVSVKIFEGERALTKDNNSFGQLFIVSIEVTFDIDVSGILNVIAEDKMSGRASRITITKGQLSTEEVQYMVKDVETFKKDDDSAAARIKAKS